MRLWQEQIISRYDGFSYDDISFVWEKEGWIVGDTGLILQIDLRSRALKNSTSKEVFEEQTDSH